MTPTMRRGWFRPSKGMQRISDRRARELDREADRHFDRMVEDLAKDPPVKPEPNLCACGERAGKSGLCRECFLVRQIDRAIAAAQPCRCGAPKKPLAMHCDACLIGRDKCVDYGDSE